MIQNLVAQAPALHRQFRRRRPPRQTRPHNLALNKTLAGHGDEVGRDTLDGHEIHVKQLFFSALSFLAGEGYE